MKVYIFFPLNFIIFATTFAMEIVDNSTKSIISLAGNQVVYIGKEKVRKDLERIYKKEFSLNTIFFPIAFKNVQRTWLFGLMSYELECPEYIDYESIGRCRENDILELTLHGKKERFICNQQQAKTFSRRDFQDIVGIYYQNFVHRANCLMDGEESLIDAQVIKKNPYNVLDHGQNGNPKILKLLEE